MRKHKNKFLIVISLFFIMALSLIPWGAWVSVKAEDSIFDFNSTQVQAQCAELTNSDNISENFILGNYIQKMKEGGYATTEEGLAEHGVHLKSILPQEVFFNAGEYFYAGKEYAFYVENPSYSDYTEVMLIDYNLSFDENKNIATFRIDVLNVMYNVFMENEVFYARGNTYDSGLYLKAPGLYGSIVNLHEPNDFDSDYAKNKDNGAIIEQVRFNYAGSYQTVNYSAQPLIKFGASLLLDYLGEKIPGISELKLVYEYFDALNSAVEIKTTDVTSSAEGNLFENDKKSVQLADGTKSKFTRVFKVAPQTANLMINDYVEAKAVFSAEDTPAQLFFGATFNLCDSTGELIFEQPIQVSFLDEIYERTYSHEYNQERDMYILPDMQQVYSFMPDMEGEYRFVSDSLDSITVYDSEKESYVNVSANNTFSLKANRVYYIEIKNIGSSVLRGKFNSVFAAPVMPIDEIEISGSYNVYSINNNKNCYYDIVCNDSDTYIRVCNKEMHSIGEAYGSISVEKVGTDTLFISFTNNALGGGSMTVTCAERKVIHYVTEGESLPEQQVINGACENLNTPTERTGYDFKGWFDNATYTGSAVTVSSVLEMNQADITLYAKWDLTAYSIVYEENGGIAIPDSSYTMADSIALVTDITKENSVFLGWYESATFEGVPVARINVGTVGNKTYYARWANDTYTISNYELNTEEGQNIVFSEQTVTVPYAGGFSLPVPTSVGFAFVGWYYGDERLTDENGQSVVPYLYTESVTVSAKWDREEIRFKLTNVDGQSVWLIESGLSETIASIEYAASLSPNDLITQLRISENQEVRQQVYNFLYQEGKIYKYLSYDPEGNIVAGGQVMDYVDANNEIILYPQYEDEQYTVYFHYFGLNEQKIYLYGEAIEYPAYDKPGYDSAGVWHDTITNQIFNKTHMHDLSENSEGNSSISLTLQFTIYEYSITYNIPSTTFDGEIFDESLITWGTKIDAYNVETAVVLPTLTSVVYEFLGWYEDIEFTKEVEEIPEGTIGNKTFYAKLKLRVFTVSFNYDGGSVGPLTMSAKYGKTIVLPTSTRSSYIGTWLSWTIEDQYLYISDFGTEYRVTQNITLTAQWKAIGTITYKYLTFGEKQAEVYWDGYLLAPAYYVQEVGLDLSRYLPYFKSDSPYSPQLVFVDWCTDETLSTAISRISKNSSSNITLYARWRYDYDNPCRTGEYLITDAGRFKQSNYDLIYIGMTQTLCNNLKSIGIEKLYLNFKLRLWEEVNGYQYIYFYADSGQDKLLWSKEKHEHKPGALGSNKIVFNEIVELSIGELVGVNYIYVRYDASGEGSDNWKNDIMYCEISYASSKKCLENPEFTWAYQDPL